MQAMEAEAIRRGCRGAYLDTFSYQARPFYERLGYEVFGTLDDYPAGHQRFAEPGNPPEHAQLVLRDAPLRRGVKDAIEATIDGAQARAKMLDLFVSF